MSINAPRVQMAMLHTIKLSEAIAQATIAFRKAHPAADTLEKLQLVLSSPNEVDLFIPEYMQSTCERLDFQPVLDVARGLTLKMPTSTFPATLNFEITSYGGPDQPRDDIMITSILSDTMLRMNNWAQEDWRTVRDRLMDMYDLDFRSDALLDKEGEYLIGQHHMCVTRPGTDYAGLTAHGRTPEQAITKILIRHGRHKVIEMIENGASAADIMSRVHIVNAVVSEIKPRKWGDYVTTALDEIQSRSPASQEMTP